ncbi:MAG: hypothetical protein AAF851_22410 [Myxococcota bacterium]
MTFLERFDTQMGVSLSLKPIDADDAVRKGGRGPTWWSLRFRQVDVRAQLYEQAVGGAKRLDRALERTYGEADTGESVEDNMKRMAAFWGEEQRKLQNKAARYAIPHDWRR